MASAKVSIKVFEQLHAWQIWSEFDTSVALAGGGAVTSVIESEYT